MKDNPRLNARNRVHICVLAALLCLCVALPLSVIRAEVIQQDDSYVENPALTVEPIEPEQTEPAPPTAEPTPPDSTNEPTPPAIQYKYTIDITPPIGWRNTSSAKVKIALTDDNGTGWDSVFIRVGSNGWQDVTSLFNPMRSINFDVYENDSLTVRITAPDGTHHEKVAYIDCFDRTPPAVTAGVQGEYLHVDACDAQSGIAGIQVNSFLFTTLANGKLNVHIEDILKKYEKLAVRAYDYAGNFSEAVTLDNPYYGTSSCPTATPTLTKKPSGGATGTPKPTKKPSGSASSTAKPTVTPTATASPTPSPEITAIPTPTPTTTPVVIVATPTPEYIEVGPGQPFAAEGNMKSLDLLYSAHTNKQFITVQSRNGETYFLVIDYDKPIDEEAELYETYFLNLVDDRDLLSVLSEDELPMPEPTVIMVTPEPTPVPTQAPPVQEKSSGGVGSAVLLILIVLGAGGAVWYFKFRKDGKGSKKAPVMDEYDFDDDDDIDDESEVEMEDE